jgi:hypothetical protein
LQCPEVLKDTGQYLKGHGEKVNIRHLRRSRRRTYVDVVAENYSTENKKNIQSFLGIMQKEIKYTIQHGSDAKSMDIT